MPPVTVKSKTSVLNGNDSKTEQEGEEGSFTNGINDIENDDKEEERDSLLLETADQSALLSRQSLRFRGASNRTASINNNNDNGDSTILGLLRGSLGGRYACHSVALLSALAVALLVPLILQNLTMEQQTPEDLCFKKPPHAPSLGGGLNPGYAAGAASATDPHSSRSEPHYDVVTKESTAEFPKSNVGVAVVSTTKPNQDNAHGHFWHDPFLSPYASMLYAANAASAETATAEQAAFNASRAAVLERYGFFDPPDFGTLVRPDFSKIPHRDMPVSQLLQTQPQPKQQRSSYWQADAAYLKTWLVQAQNLVKRVQQAVYEEYGYTANSAAGQMHFRVLVRENFDVTDDGVAYETVTDSADDDNDQKQPQKKKLICLAYMPPVAWRGLIRKLLHAMMTHDDFYAVAVGRDYTYAGNNFAESQMMQFNDILEPVLDKLGVRLIARNMGMDASTTVQALGGADIYGEADILWYIPDARSDKKLPPESMGQLDFLHKQAILSGERMPLILTPRPGNILGDTKGNAWIGNIQPGTEICNATMPKGVETLSSIEACQYLWCDPAADNRAVCDKYRSQCWVPRSDWNPTPDDTHQNADTGRLKEGYPNYQQHRWEGRKLAMMVLIALEQALDLWFQQTVEGNVPLPEEMWHVGQEYEKLRESVRTLEREPGQAVSVPHCEQFLQNLNPMICHMAMHAYTEWTPQVNPVFNRIKQQIVVDTTSTAGVAVPVRDDRSAYTELYDSVDLRPVTWKVPAHAVDVHMVALATKSEVNKDMSLSDLYPKTKKKDDYIEGSKDFDEYDDTSYDGGSGGGRGGGNRKHRALKSATTRSLARSYKDQWIIHNAPLGFCDGSAQSRCNRAVGNTCLLANYNHYRSGLLGSTPDSGWIYLKLDNFKEGVILVRFEWKSVDDATADEMSTSTNPLPDDFYFDFSVDGATKSWNKNTFGDAGVHLTDDLIVHPLLMNKELSRSGVNATTTVKVGLRVRGKEGTHLLLTHIYYA